MAPCTSSHWPYHKDLLVFRLEFRLSPVCEYLSYFYQIANDYLAIQENTQTGKFENILFEKKPCNFLVCHFTLGILDKTKLWSCKFREIVLHPSEIPSLKIYIYNHIYYIYTIVRKVYPTVRL